MATESSGLTYIGARVPREFGVAATDSSTAVPGDVRWIDDSDLVNLPALARSIPHLIFEMRDFSEIGRAFSRISPTERTDRGSKVVFVDAHGIPVKLIETAAAKGVDHVGKSRFGPGVDYHSFWVPRSEPADDDTHLAKFKMYVNHKPNCFGVGWVCYEPDAPYHESILRLPHVALTAENLEHAIDGLPLLIPPKETQPGLRIAFARCGDFPIEFLEIDSTVLPQGI